MRKTRIFTYIILFVIFSIPFWANQYVNSEWNTMRLMHSIDSLIPVDVDSLLPKIQNQTLKAANDSLPKDSVQTARKILDAVVDYTANDSIVLRAGNTAFLYGDSNIKYGDISLKGERISMNMDSSIVTATYGLDSIGKEFGYPVFADKGSEFESKSMRYNFKTKKGYGNTVITEQGEGYIIADAAKKNPDDSFFMKGGKYTTCDEHDHPHFYVSLTRAKVRPKKNVVTGPAYLVIEDLPIPFLGLPFGFFPFSDKYSSGVIMPSYGDEMERGFNLHDGGYYFAINDNIDLALTGEIFTKGSWGADARSTYRWRYKHSGSFNMGYRVTIRGEKNVDQTVSKDFGLNWTHSQDPKANMFRVISASVNFSTSTFDRNNLATQFTPMASQNTKSSSATLTQRFPNSPWSLTAAVNAAQRTIDSTVSLTMPNLTVIMSRISPFKRKEAVGKERWYERIQMSYTGDFRNSIETKENKLFNSSFQKDWRNAMQHQIPIAATFSALNYLNITPSVNYTERWYTSHIRQKWDAEKQSHVTRDTINSFSRVYNYSTALSFQTRMYGFYKPLFSKTTLIRHVFTPSISFSYAPDFSDPRFGFYETYSYQDANGRDQQYTYSPYQSGMFGTAPKGAQGLISFSFENNLEMKVASSSDSTGYKKISLVDNFGVNFSHNMMANEFKWSDIGTSTRLRFSKSFVVNINAVFDPYLYRLDENEKIKRVNELRIQNGRGFGRLRSTGFAISPSLNQDTFKKWFSNDKDEKDDGKKNTTNNDNSLSEAGDEVNPGASEEKRSRFEGKKDDGEYDAGGYLKNDIKWNLGLNLSFNYGYDTSKPPIEKGDGFVEYRGKITKNFGFSGSIQPTRNWNFTFDANYDFDARQIAHMSCNITRNLHCWSISANIIPLGPYQSYFVSLRASSSLLQDLKYEQRGRGSSFDPNWD